MYLTEVKKERLCKLIIDDIKKWYALRNDTFYSICTDFDLAGTEFIPRDIREFVYALAVYGREHFEGFSYEYAYYQFEGVSIYKEYTKYNERKLELLESYLKHLQNGK